MFEDIPVDVGVIYEGERIRRNNMQVELGGPKQPAKFELVRAKKMDEVEDGKVTIIGPDLKDLPEGGNVPFGIFIEVAGKNIEVDLEGVTERRIHEYLNFIEGIMHLNQRYDIWIRVSKKSFKKGLTSFVPIGTVLGRLYKSELPFIEKIQVTFITDPVKVKEMYDEAVQIYEARDAKARGMKDDEVDTFYGCSLCQSFAPTHMCVITPQRYSNCGSISWFDGRASAQVDPKGPVFAIKKGEMLDAEKGEFSGINESIKQKTLGAVDKVWMYTGFGYPHTSCGCFEAMAFYIPEVEGYGIVDRGYKGVTVNGLPFSTLADSGAGGRQVDGFHGIAIEYMRSPKFLQADGGWDRVVWMPQSVKDRVKEFMPKEAINNVATENDANTVEELKTFLKTKNHPVVKTWKEPEIEEVTTVKG
ncbi:CO dehydrogenase/CO-methylating acetyl-CoA synthase complex subunit beta, partial [Candidatus Bathyarchaeota archaeon]|nr:CO dehydrogenase/CO-methylating acetyl-CoA synthase complex subunit beta [Candidatus Bathyarchaeota archaeon]